MIKKFNLKALATIVVITTLLASCGVNKMIKKANTVKYEATPKVLETNGGKISIAINGEIPAKYFNKKAFVEITPVLKYKDGSETLKSITLKGEKAEGEGIVINTKTGGKFSYNDIIDYKPAMNNSILEINPKVSLKKKSAELGKVKLADGVIYTSTRTQNVGNTIIANHGYEKETIITKKADIYFAKNLANINMRLALNKNQNSKDAITELIDFISQGWKIKNIEINAWASPEGEESFNQGLSEKRAKTTTKYLNRLFKRLNRKKGSLLTVKNPEKEVEFNTYAKGEDWNGFLKAVNASEISDKNSILNVINSQIDVNKKEQEIRDMSLVYKEIENNILPELRRGEIIINCFEPKKTDEEIAELSTTNPEALDIYELLYSATLTKDLNIKNKIYKAAATLNPKCWKAYNNAGIINLKLGNNAEAEKYLSKANKIAPNNAKIINNLGCLALSNKNFKKAESYFLNAKKLGVNENMNLGIIAIRKANYNKAVNLLKDNECTYNLALAQLLNGNNSKAAQTLKCAPENAETFYLLAVVGARTNNESMLLENLKKAVDANNSLKEIAGEDREFINYFDNAEFQKIIK